MGNINIDKFKSLYETSEDYKEVRENDKMKHVHILCISGSYSYGTNRDDSDIDIRGIVDVSKRILVGQDLDWGTVDFAKTDTAIYTYKKFLSLILNGNPSIIGLLGNDLDDYLILSDEGKELVCNYSGLLRAKTIYDTFVGYSVSMLKRLELAELNNIEDRKSLIDKKLSILKGHVDNIPNRFDYIKDVDIKFDIKDDEVYASRVELKNVHINDLFDIIVDLKNVSSSFGTKGKRNKKKSEFKLNKHCMHLVRVLLMGNELLETGKIVTYRKHDLELLHDILNGKFMGQSGKMNSSFYELVDELKTKAKYAFDNTVLPMKVDEDKLEYFYDLFFKASLKNLKER